MNVNGKASTEVMDRLHASQRHNIVAGWDGEVLAVARDARGRVKWEELVKNNLTYQGSQYVLSMAFDSASTRIANGSWYYALYTAARDATATGATAATSECASTGYARQVCTSAAAWAFDQNPSYYRASTTAYTFSPGANDWAALWGLGILGGGTANTAGQTATWFLAFAAFSQTRDLAPNDTLQVQYRVTLSSP